FRSRSRSTVTAHAFRRVPFLLVLPRGLRGLLVVAREPVSENLAARLQLFLLRLLELEISFPDHGVERARLFRWLDAGADGRSAKTARLVDHEPVRESRHDRV